MFYGFFVRAILNSLILFACVSIVSGKRSRPDFQDVFFVALGITIVSTVLLIMLFPGIGYFSLVPIFAVNVLIIMRFLGLGAVTAVVALVIYEAVNMLLPF